MSGDLEGFATIPRAIQRDPDISVQEKIVYLALSSRANARLQCWPSLAVIAKDASVSESTARRALDSLRERGFVTWTVDPKGRPGRAPNIYTLGGPEEGVSHRHPTPVTETPQGCPTDLLTIEGNDGREVDVAPDPILVAFEEFWTTYPSTRRAGSKAKNLAKFRTVVKAGVDPQMIVEAIKARVAWWEQEQTPDGYRKTSLPWLNGGCWEEEIVGLRAKVATRDAYSFTEGRPTREPNWDIA